MVKLYVLLLAIMLERCLYPWLASRLRSITVSGKSMHLTNNTGNAVKASMVGKKSIEYSLTLILAREIAICDSLRDAKQLRCWLLRVHTLMVLNEL